MIPLSCCLCRTELAAIVLTDADESRAANSGETCCAVPESPAGRLDPISPEAVVGGLAASGVHDDTAGTGAGEVAPGQDTGSAWVTRSADCPEAPAQARRVAHRRGFLSGVPAFAARRWAVGR